MSVARADSRSIATARISSPRSVRGEMISRTAAADSMLRRVSDRTGRSLSRHHAGESIAGVSRVSASTKARARSFSTPAHEATSTPRFLVLRPNAGRAAPASTRGVGACSCPRCGRLSVKALLVLKGERARFRLGALTIVARTGETPSAESWRSGIRAAAQEIDPNPRRVDRS